MQPAYVAATAAAAAGILAHERRMRRRAERFAAAVFESLLRAIDANDPQTGAHVRRVAEYSLILAEALVLDERELRTVELTALFHDIGKIHEALFDIVHEPRKLTARERRAIATHPLRGAEVLAPIAHFHPRLAEAVLSHHERWDGRGYPRGIRGRNIPLAARIVAVADTFDAVTKTRRYRHGRRPEVARDILIEGRGTQFDPELIDLLLLPPVFRKFAATLKSSNGSTRQLPLRKETDGIEAAPKVKIRWRTRSRPPESMQRKLSAAKR